MNIKLRYRHAAKSDSEKKDTNAPTFIPMMGVANYHRVIVTRDIR